MPKKLSPKYCELCAVRYQPSRSEQRFCCHACSLTFTNARRTEARKKCIGCHRPTSAAKTTYCSVPCRQNHLIQRWLNGEVDTSTWGHPPEGVRRFLLEEAGHRCTRCGWNEVHPVTGRVPLEIDHTDGDSMNNSRENLVVLCPNCHALTPTFRNLNKGRGRQRKLSAQ